MSEPQSVESPCISVCTLDNNDICLGCHRSLEEIGAWSLSSREQQLLILQQAAQRKAATDPLH